MLGYQMISPLRLFSVISLNFIFTLVYCGYSYFDNFKMSHKWPASTLTKSDSLICGARGCHVGKRCREICDRGQSLDRLKFCFDQEPFSTFNPVAKRSTVYN